MAIVDEIAGAGVRGWLKCFHVVGHMAAALPVGSFDGEQSQDDDLHAQRSLRSHRGADHRAHAHRPVVLLPADRHELEDAYPVA